MSLEDQIDRKIEQKQKEREQYKAAILDNTSLDEAMLDSADHDLLAALAAEFGSVAANVGDPSVDDRDFGTGRIGDT